MCPTGRYRDTTGDSDFRPAFDVLDADQDGKISREDLKTFYSSVVADPSDDDIITSMISTADSDHNGFVEFEEFERVLGSTGSTAEKKAIMEEVFRAMDRDGDGKVGFDDLKGYMGSAGLIVSDEEIRIMIRMGGGDGMEGVCYEGLLKILAVDSAFLFR